MSVFLSFVICFIIIVVFPILDKIAKQKENRRGSQIRYENERKLNANLYVELRDLIQRVERQIFSKKIDAISELVKRINFLNSRLVVKDEPILEKIKFLNLVLKVTQGTGASEYSNILNFLNKSGNYEYINIFAQLFETCNLTRESYVLYLKYEIVTETKTHYLERQSTKIEFQILRKNENQFNFKHITEISLVNSNVLQVFSLHSYFPKFVTESKYFIGDNHNNHTVYLFKDGEYKTVLDNLLSTLKKSGLFEKVYSNTAWSVMVIPSSTMSKTNLRFRKFSQKFAEDIKITDGFEAITTIDRSQYKGFKKINKIASLQFKMELISGKCILLFDDIITTGESFRQIANMLIQMGAKEIIGITIGKTIVPFKKDKC